MRAKRRQKQFGGCLVFPKLRKLRLWTVLFEKEKSMLDGF